MVLFYDTAQRRPEFSCNVSTVDTEKISLMLLIIFFVWPRHAQTVSIWKLPPHGSNSLLYKSRAGIKYVNEELECVQFVPCNLSVKRSYFGINNFIVGLLEMSTVNCIGLDCIRDGIGKKLDLDLPPLPPVSTKYSSSCFPFTC